MLPFQEMTRKLQLEITLFRERLVFKDAEIKNSRMREHFDRIFSHRLTKNEPFYPRCVVGFFALS